MTKAQNELTVEDELGDIPASSDDGMNVNLRFPKGTNPQAVRAAMAAVQRITAREVKKIGAMDANRELYMKEGGRRWKCRVNSMRKGIKTFETIIADPKNPDRPVPVRVRCGVIISQGLTKFTIDCIKYEHSYSMELIENINPNASMALQYKQVRVPHYSVDVFEEIENPLPVGKVGHRAVQEANERAELAAV